MTPKIRVLIVDDSADDAALVLDALEGGGFEIDWRRVDSAPALASALVSDRWDLVISDHSMPQFSAPAALAIVRTTAPDLPFIIVSGTIRDEAAVEAMRSGAQDYLLKDNLSRLAAAVSRELVDSTTRKERREAQERLHYLAHHDPATGLYSRAWLQERVAETSAGHLVSPYGLIAVGLDGLRDMSQAFGQEYADAALTEIATRLVQDLAGLVADVARIGEDRLGVGLVQEPTGSDLVEIISRVLEICRNPFPSQGHQLNLRPRAGLAFAASMPNFKAESLLLCAEMALEDARRSELTSSTYSSEMGDQRTKHLLLLADLQQAIAHRELRLVYQPKVDVHNGSIRGVEALLRWNHPYQGEIPPDIFIPLAEHAGFISTITEWVINAAVSQVKAWHQAGLTIPVAVNISGHDLRSQELVRGVKRVLTREGVPGETLCFEVTESALVANAGVAVETLQGLADLGARTSIDDFGTGYSSLAYLRELPLTELKIDRSFLQAIESEPKARAIVASVARLGRDLDLEIVAEGVEDGATLRLIRELGCHTAQGHYICWPQPSSEIEAWLRLRTQPNLVA